MDLTFLKRRLHFVHAHSHSLSLSLSLSFSFFLSFVWFNLRIMFKRFQRAYRDQRIHVGFCDAALFCDSEQGRPGSFIPHEKQGDTWSPHKEEETGASQVRVIQLWDDSLLPSLSPCLSSVLSIVFVSLFLRWTLHLPRPRCLSIDNHSTLCPQK